MSVQRARVSVQRKIQVFVVPDSGLVNAAAFKLLHCCLLFHVHSPKWSPHFQSSEKWESWTTVILCELLTSRAAAKGKIGPECFSMSSSLLQQPASRKAGPECSYMRSSLAEHQQKGKLDQRTPTECCHGTPSGSSPAPHSPSVKFGHVAELSPVGFQQQPLGALGRQVGRAALGEAEAHGARGGEADVAAGQVGGIVHQPARIEHGQVVQVEHSTWWRGQGHPHEPEQLGWRFGVMVGCSPMQGCLEMLLEGCECPRLVDVAPSSAGTGQAECDSSLGAQGGGKSMGSSAAPLGWKML